MSQSLYRKWRPLEWGQVAGQEHIVTTLQNAVAGSRVAHAYLFAGPRGTGKTTTARLLAKAVNCLAEDLRQRPCNQCAHCQAVNQGRFLDLIEIDAASNTSVEDVRDLRDKINFSPSQGKYKVYIIDEVHMLSTAAFNALLKTLEEPPPHAIFILATTEVHKIPATVLSRCQRHEFRRLPVGTIVSYLRPMAEEEELEVEPEALALIARQATGSMRDAISLLDQLASSGEGPEPGEGAGSERRHGRRKITLEKAQTVLGTATSQAVIDLVEAILTRQPAQGLACIHKALDAGTDPRQFARQAVEYLRGLLLIQMGAASQVEAVPEVKAQMARQASSFEPPVLVGVLRAFNTAATDLRSGWHPGLLLELAFAEALTPAEAGDAPGVPGARPSGQASRQAPAGGIPAERGLSSPASIPSRPAPSEAASPPEPAPGERGGSPELASPARRETVGAPAGEAPSMRMPAGALEKASGSEAASGLAGSGAADGGSVSGPADSEAEDGRSDSPEAAASGGVSFQALLQNWPRVRALVKRHSPPTEALLNSCKLMGIKDGALIIGLSPVLKGKMETGSSLEITSRAIAAITGTHMEVRCVLSTGKASNLPSGVEVESDGIVGTALRDMGGEVVDVQ